MEYVLIFIIGLITSFLAGISGGGAGLVILPALIALGIAPLDAVGAMKLGFVGFVITSMFSKSARPYIRKEHLIPLIIVVIVASLIGPLFSFKLGDTQVKFISSVLILITAAASLLSWKIASNSRSVGKLSQYIGYFLFFVTSSLLAGFGSGVSLLNNYIVIALLGLSPLEALSTRRVVGLIAAPLQFIVFAKAGHVNYPAGWALLAGLSIGGLLGLNYAVKKGNDFVKKTMAVTAVFLVILIFV